MSTHSDEASNADEALQAQVVSLTKRVAELESELANSDPVSITIVPECEKCAARAMQDKADAIKAAAESKALKEKEAAEAKEKAESEAASAAKEQAAKALPVISPTKPITPKKTAVSSKPSVVEVRQAVDTLSNHSRGEASSAMCVAAHFLCVKHRDQCSNSEGLLRRSILVLKQEARDAGARHSGSSISHPGRELAGVLTTSPTGSARAAAKPRASAPARTQNTTLSSPRRTSVPPSSPTVTPSERKAKGRALRASHAVSLAEYRAPDETLLGWMDEKEKKEVSRENMKKRVVERDAKWMEQMSKRQADRLKQSRKQEEAAEAAMRVELLKSRTKAREENAKKAEDVEEPGLPSPAGNEGIRAESPTIAQESERLFGSL